MNKGNLTVFISCGQYTQEEKELGKEIKRLVEKHTPYEAYFSETVTSLDSLTTKIFEMLNKASGLITVMHHRGNVSTTTPGKSIIRGSIWVEQEIAIAAFLRQILRKNIETLSFIQEGIDLEGVRKYLHFNPKPFKENKDIVEELERCLPSWPLDYTQPDGSVRRSETDIVANEILNELKLNAKIAKTHEPWTTYSIKKRDRVPLLEEPMGSEVADKISDLYINLESINSRISRVGGGNWGDQYYKKYYSDLVEPIETAINLIKEKIQIPPKEKTKPEIRRVVLDYPSKSGLQKNLEAQGYTLSWSKKDMDVGCEPVIQDQSDGSRIMFKDESETLTLLRKKK